MLIAADRGPRAGWARSSVIHDFGTGRGIDGMTVTTDGRIVAAAGSDKAGVLVLRPRVKSWRRFPHPRNPPTSSSAGATAKRSTFRAGKSLYRIKTTMTGYPALAARSRQ